MIDVGPIDWAALSAHNAALMRVAPWPEAAALIPRGPVYLASPVTSYLERGLEDEAARLASLWAAELLAQGLSPFAPAAQWVGALMAAEGAARDRLLAMSHAEWMRRCVPMLHAARALVIPPIPGWAASRGVWAEACLAVVRNTPVVIIEAPR